MRRRGRMTYVPANFLNLMEQVKKEKGIQRNTIAFEEIGNWTLVGREVEKIVHLGNIPKRKKGLRGLI